MSVVEKVFCKVLNNRLVAHLDKGGALHEDQAGFRGCVDNIYTLNELVKGRLGKGRTIMQLSRKPMIQCRLVV